MTRRMGLTVALLVLTAFLAASSVAVSRARRDRTPPDIVVRLEPQVIAERPFEVYLSADEPVTYTLRYGDTVSTRVSQNDAQSPLSLTGLPGSEELLVTATDEAGNSSARSYSVYGVPIPQPLIKTPKAVVPGEPFSVRVVWAPESVRAASLTLSVDGRPLETFEEGAARVGLASVPLGTPPGEGVVGLELTDQYGRNVHVTRLLTVLADPHPIQELALPAALLASSTPENEVLEAQVLQDAYARAARTSTPPLEPFLLPITGRSTSGYGTPRRYERGGAVIYHEGADIAAPVGTPVRATNAGRVLVADFFPIKGGLVVIDHGGGVSSLYFHQSKILVKAGDWVERGDVIGEVGTTGRSTGPHLHWEMRVNGVTSDPLAWVDKVLP